MVDTRKPPDALPNILDALKTRAKHVQKKRQLGPPPPTQKFYKPSNGAFGDGTGAVLEGKDTKLAATKNNTKKTFEDGGAAKEIAASRSHENKNQQASPVRMCFALCWMPCMHPHHCARCRVCIRSIVLGACCDRSCGCSSTVGCLPRSIGRLFEHIRLC